MNLPQSSRLQLAPDLSMCRVLNGMWQVSGAHGAIDPERAVESMFDYVDAGFTTFDANTAALNAVFSEWTSVRDYPTRVANLRGTGSGPVVPIADQQIAHQPDAFPAEEQL